MYRRLIELMDATLAHAEYADIGALDLVAMEISGTIEHLRQRPGIDPQVLIMAQHTASLLTEPGSTRFGDAEDYYDRVSTFARATKLMMLDSENAEYTLAVAEA